MEEADNHYPKQLKPYMWKKGMSGNLKGRPKGKTLKEFTREYLLNLSDDEKIEYLASLPSDIVWKMAEGMPQTNTDITSGGKPIIQVAQEILDKHEINTSPSDNS